MRMYKKMFHPRRFTSYLAMAISGYGDVKAEVKQETTKATRIAAYLKHIIWQNNHMDVETKSKICKPIIRPIILQQRKEY